MTELTDAYWEGARKGRLVLQRCGDCGLVRHYPQLLCPACHSFAVEHVDAAGTGSVHSWTVSHHAFNANVADDVPYVLVTVELPEGVRVLGRLDGEPSTGLPVRVSFAQQGGQTPLLRFVPDEGAT